MTERPEGRERSASRAAGVIRRPFAALAALLELPLSRRGLPVVFLAVAAGMTAVGWLRPPLSADFSGLAIPLGIRPRAYTSAEDVLHGARAFVLDSPGAILLVLIVVGFVVVLARPENFGVVAGVLLAEAVAANAGVAFNHPLLVEALDYEFEQRQQIVSVLVASKENVVANISNDRIGVPGEPAGDQQRGDLLRGYVYLLYGPYLVAWAALGLLLGGQGLVGERLTRLSAWALLGVVLAGIVCGPRLLAEYRWLQATHFEAEGDDAAAQQALHDALASCPEFAGLERTALLRGKLDFRQNLKTPQEQFFQAYQLARAKDRRRPNGFLEDLPWQIAGSVDTSAALATPLGGVDLADIPDLEETLAFSEGPGIPSGSPQAATLARYMERREALGRMEDLLDRSDTGDLPVRKHAERLWVNTGLNYYLQEPVLLGGSEDSYHDPDRRLLAAHNAWQRAYEVLPGRRDTAFYLGAVLARIDRSRPDLAEAQMASALEGLADLPLRADILVTLGHAYFEAGQMREARLRYARSFDVFSLPALINYRAQKGLGGS